MHELIQRWERNIEELKAGTYQGGTPGRPLMACFDTTEQRIAYCQKMIKNIEKHESTRTLQNVR
jgi:hypothetical protein